MRAILISEWPSESDISIEGDNFNHLKVVRVKIGEEVKILDGNGRVGISKVKEINKKNIIMTLLKSEKITPPLVSVNLAIILPKKDAFESIVRIAVEMGVKEIYPLAGDFSQFELNENYLVDRLSKIVESSVVQSNNPFRTKISHMTSFDIFLSELNTPLWMMDSKEQKKESHQLVNSSNENITILIGPEAGFSNREYQLLDRFKKEIVRFHFPVPIMTAPTATAASLSLFWSKHC